MRKWIMWKKNNNEFKYWVERWRFEILVLIVVDYMELGLFFFMYDLIFLIVGFLIGKYFLSFWVMVVKCWRVCFLGESMGLFRGWLWGMFFKLGLLLRIVICKEVDGWCCGFFCLSYKYGWNVGV